MKRLSLFFYACICLLALPLPAGQLSYDPSSPELKFAATDLVRCLRAVTGKPLSALPFDVELRQKPGLADQEWHLQSDEKKLIISGSGNAGIVYGVYTFLEKYAGCSWFAPDTEVLPKNPGWKMPKLDERGKPAFSRREMYIGYDYIPRDWRLRNKENYRAQFFNMHMGSPSNSHTFDYYVETVRKKRPDLFFQAISGAKCHMLCLTNPEVRKIVLDELVEYIKKDRKKYPADNYPKIYDISQQDGGSGEQCYCPGCRKIAEAEGSYSGVMLYFVNALAREIKKIYPDIILRTFAYSYTREPPKKIEAEDNVIVQFCAGYLFDPLLPNTKDGNLLVKWGSHAQHKALWSYWKDYHYSYEYPYVKKHRDIAEEIRFCHSQGVIHYFAENEAPLNRSFAMCGYYLMLKLLDNPYQDVEALTDKFMAGYYGPASDPMRKYLDYLEKRLEVTKAYMDRAFFETVDSLLDQAEKLAAGNPLYLRHVGWERSVVDRAMFNNLDQLQAAGYKTDVKACARRYEKNTIENVRFWNGFRGKKNLINERILSLQQEAQVYSRFPVPKPQQFKGCRVINRQWCQVRMIRKTHKYVNDPDAACGVAFKNRTLKPRLPFSMGFYNRNSQTGGNIQLNSQTIPKDEKFHLYRLGNTVIDNSVYVYFDNDWRFRTYLKTIGIIPERWDIWVSAKFSGPVFVPGSKNANAVLFDQLFFVQEPDPMLKYQPVDSSRNLLKNGGFEKGSDKWIADWGAPNAHHYRDSQVKHSGKYSLRIGNVPQSFDFAAFQMGKIADLKQDLLIRGWCRNELLNNSGKNKLPFLGLWTGTKDGHNGGIKIPVVNFYPGKRDWTRFEYLLRIKELQEKSAGFPEKKRPDDLQLRVNLFRQPGTVWIDDLEVIPLDKK